MTKKIVEEHPSLSQTSATEEPRKPPCPACGSRESTVRGNNGATRYRRCEHCGRSFSTIEIVKK